jgi:hypothetical protein
MPKARRATEELYDLSKDPSQTINVAAEPGYAEIKARMAAELMARLKEVGDPRVTADPVPFESGVFTQDTKTNAGKAKGKGKGKKGKAKAE